MHKEKVVSLGKQMNISFSVILVVIGFMLAIQFQTVNEPVVRDTRDMWELREDMKKAQELHSELINEIYKYEEKIEQYNSERNDGKEQVLKETLEELKEAAGLTEVKGPGIILTVDRAFNEIGMPTETVSADILRRLLNDLNSFQAEAISIDNHRVINTTVIREIQRTTKIDSYSIHTIPFQIKVMAQDAEKLYNRMKASEAVDEFFVENLKLTISKPLVEVTIPAYDDPIRIKHMEPVKTEKGGN
ncbi:DUF881 domain-containing protein [Litchfieldia salsa]|uniref:Uncharacterized conserved protein YlxW, UPF0749 family n=1 Tax=Litchfieldia salsa TaxID=930152 RepID=A0A1H0RE72_9BACI|nr:DUF881 domain-containing protein [Litchfieldia salsa]SDP27721.1 Uncharacterized conserved protein YlxW, UPF0749 family [Litchfieldia salsa]